MEIILIKALQLIFCLSLLVFIHEGGHFIFAKFSGVKVEKFYLFFNPYFHIFSTRDKWFTRLFPYFKDNETEYGIGWLPLGGYVSIAGMVDETKSAEDIAARERFQPEACLAPLPQHGGRRPFQSYRSIGNILRHNVHMGT